MTQHTIYLLSHITYDLDSEGYETSNESVETYQGFFLDESAAQVRADELNLDNQHRYGHYAQEVVRRNQRIGSDERVWSFDEWRDMLQRMGEYSEWVVEPVQRAGVTQ